MIVSGKPPALYIGVIDYRPHDVVSPQPSNWADAWCQDCHILFRHEDHVFPGCPNAVLILQQVRNV